MKRMIFTASLLCFVVFLNSSFMSQSQVSNLNDPYIIVRKKARKLELFEGDKLVKKYKMVLGFSPSGDKSVEGDGRTPEGDFFVFTKNDQSSYYLSLGLSYPNVQDAKRGLSERLITREEYDQIIDSISRKQMPPQKTRLGGEIYIHGGGTDEDWTDGCVAVKDEDIKEIFDAAKVGMRVTILP